MVNSKKTLVAEGSRRPKEPGKTGLLFRAFFRRYVQPAVPDPRLWKRTKKQRDFLRGSKKFPRPLRYPEKCRTGCPDWIFGVYCPAESRCFFASFLYLFSPSRKASLHSRRRVSAGEAAGTKFSCFFVCPFPCPFPPERQFFPLRRRASAGKCNGYQIQLFFRVPFSTPERPPLPPGGRFFPGPCV